MRVGVLTSSRADFGIYRPLLLKLRDSSDFQLKVIAFGGHLEERLGNTVEEIRKEFNDVMEVGRTLESIETPFEMSHSMGATTLEIAKTINSHSFDLIFCLGDRFEMFSAVSAINPFEIPIAHIHGGETTLGAIDNKYRHAITHLSDVHFTTCEQHSSRVKELIGNEENVFNVGSLSLHNMATIKTLEPEDIKRTHGVDFSNKTALVTYHPVTNELEKTEEQTHALLKALSDIDYDLVFTGVNTDPKAEKIRSMIKGFVEEKANRWYFENLGSEYYFSFMKNCTMMIGNTSSGIIEAASFNTPVVNVGNRQLGRHASENVVHAEAKEESLLAAIKKAELMVGAPFTNIYYQENSIEKIMEVLSKFKKEGLV